MTMRRIISLLLVLCLCSALIPLKIHAAASDAVEAALELLYYHEGSYGSVNRNDNGAVSVGKIQWHGDRALGLLKTIVSMDNEAALTILGEALYKEILSATDWSDRAVSAGEASAISALLVTENGKKAQDELAAADVSAYIQHGMNLGIQNMAALIYFADLENQGGYGMSGRVAKAAAAIAGSYAAVGLEEIHRAALSDSVAGDYPTRRNQTYEFCLDYVYVGTEYRIHLDANGGILPDAYAQNDLDGINVGRDTDYLVVYNTSGAQVDTNRYGAEVLVDSGNAVIGKREYLSDERQTVPADGFILSGHGKNASWVEKIELGHYVVYDQAQMKVYVYETQEAFVSHHKRVLHGEAMGQLPVPTRAGYVFTGWYTAAEGGTEITSAHVVTADMTLYAHWAEDSGEVASGWSGATQWRLTDDGTLTVYGTGNMKNYGYGGGQPWLGKGVDIKSVVIEEGVTAIGTGTFKNLTTLESVTLPDKGLTKIGEAAFYGCTALKEIEIPETIYTVWLYTFKNCTSLISVKLPKSLIKIDQGVFENCTSLSYIFFPTNVEIIGAWSFKGCTGLVEADMTWTDATKIREGAFKNCSALTTIHLPVNIQVLGDSCFYGIGATSFTVPETVTSIEAWCFARAYSLKSLYFEGNAPTIGEGAFNKIALTAHYPANNATWTPAIMQNYGGTVTWKAN